MTDLKQDGGKMYPSQRWGRGRVVSDGINRRDWLAGLAMQGIVSTRKNHKLPNNLSDTQSSTATVAYAYADAMIIQGSR